MVLSQYKKTTNIGVGIGLILQIVGKVLSNNEQEAFGSVVLLIGFGAFICGCGQYSKAKGFSAWFGALGLLSIIGLVVLALLPDRHKNIPA